MSSSLRSRRSASRACNALSTLPGERTTGAPSVRQTGATYGLASRSSLAAGLNERRAGYFCKDYGRERRLERRHLAEIQKDLPPRIRRGWANPHLWTRYSARLLPCSLVGLFEFPSAKGPYIMASKTVYDVLAWGFLAFTLLAALVLLRLWWEESRDVARREATRKISN